MTRILAIHVTVLGLLLGPLALSAPTAWLLVPVHGVFSLLVCVGAVADGWAGYPEVVRRWGFGYLVATAVMVGALQWGAHVRGAGMLYWSAPWLAALAWGWIPPVIAGGAAWIAEGRARRLTGRAVRHRRSA